MKIKTFDVTGFGGGYEAATQKMIWAGVAFLIKKKQLPKYEQFANITGICTGKGPIAKELDKVMMKACEDDCTGAMHQCAVNHIMYIMKNGYDKWHAELKEARAKDKKDSYEFEYEEDINFKMTEPDPLKRFVAMKEEK